MPGSIPPSSWKPERAWRIAGTHAGTSRVGGARTQPTPCPGLRRGRSARRNRRLAGRTPHGRPGRNLWISRMGDPLLRQRK